ncbi:MAG: hypothetical protein ACTHLU_12120 [Novosphingobium sp.]|jgi:hypothetical protein
MLSNQPVKGLDLLTRMTESASERAAAQLFGAIRLAKCDSLALDEGYLPGDVDIESWSVFADHQAVVVSVFAIAPRDDGAGTRIAGTGRFTFTTLTHKRKYRA